MTFRLRSVLAALVVGMLVVPAPALAAEAPPGAGLDRPATGMPSTAPVAQRPGRGCANGRPTRTFRDPATDGPRGVEATGLGVWNKDRDQCFWFTAVGRFRVRKAQVIRVVIDTDRRYRGYEHEAWLYSPKDGDPRRGGYLIEHFDDGSSQYVPCPVYGSFRIRQGQVRIGFPKTCIGSPAHIRVQVAVIDITRYRSGNRYRGLGDFVPNGRFTRLY